MISCFIVGIYISLCFSSVIIFLSILTIYRVPYYIYISFVPLPRSVIYSILLLIFFSISSSFRYHSRRYFHQLSVVYFLELHFFSLFSFIVHLLSFRYSSNVVLCIFRRIYSTIPTDCTFWLRCIRYRISLSHQSLFFLSYLSYRPCL